MKETEIKVMNDDEIRDFCIRKDYEIFKKEKEIERLNNIIKEAKEYIEHNYFVVGRIEKIYKILDKENKRIS